MLLEADSCCDGHPGERVKRKLPEAAPRPSALRSGEATVYQGLPVSAEPPGVQRSLRCHVTPPGSHRHTERGIATLHGDSALPVPTQTHLGVLQSGLNLSNFRE